MDDVQPRSENSPLLPNYEDKFGASKLAESFFSKSSYYSYSPVLVTRTRSAFCSALKYILICLCCILIFTIIALISQVHQNPYVPKCNKNPSTSKDSISIHVILDNSTLKIRQLQEVKEIATNYPSKTIELFLINTEGNLAKCTNETSSIDKESNDLSTYSCSTDIFYKNVKKSKWHSQKRKSLGRNWYHLKQPDGVKNNFIGNISGFAKLRNQANEVTVNDLDDLLQVYPQIRVINTSFGEIFNTTPLEKSWKRLGLPSALFAARTIRLWNSGGISFHITNSKCNKRSNLETNIYDKNSSSSNLYLNKSKGAQLLNFTLKPILPGLFREIVLLYKNISQIPLPVKNEQPKKILNGELVRISQSYFENMDKSLAVISETGALMMTRNPCHQFFGDLILKLKVSDKENNYEVIYKKSVDRYCTRNSLFA